MAQAGTVWLDVVSLFPRQTFHSRANGMRADLANMLVDLDPGFVRFPGGCFVEGDYLVNASAGRRRWATTRPGPGTGNAIWNYFSGDGLGYHEYCNSAKISGRNRCL